MPIDLFTPATMDAVVHVMPTNEGFFKKTFFNVDKPEPTEKVLVDVYKGKRRVAPFYSGKGVAPLSEKIGYATNEFQTPLTGAKDVTNIEDIMRRLPGELLMNSGTSPDERAVQLLAQTLNDFNAQIARREEVMCVQALMEGKESVIGEDVNYEIDFGLSSTHKVTLSTLWDASSTTADPIADLKTLSVLNMKDGYRKPNICIMSRDSYAAFISRCKALNYFNQWNFLDLSIEPTAKGENVTYCGRLRDPDLEIYIYDEWYLDDWTAPGTITEKPMIPKGKILLASTNARYSTYYGVLTFTDPVTNAFRSVIGTRGADSWIQKEPAQRFLKLCARPLPVPNEIDSWCVATVSATS